MPAARTLGASKLRRFWPKVIEASGQLRHLLAGCPPCGGAVVLLWLLVSEKKGQLEGFCEADELGLGGG